MEEKHPRKKSEQPGRKVSGEELAREPMGPRGPASGRMDEEEGAQRSSRSKQQRDEDRFTRK